MRVCGMKTVVPQSGLSVIGIWISDPMVNALPSPHPVQRKDEEQVRDVLRQFLPGANGPTMSLAACMFTNSPDEHFIIDTHPVLPQVVIAAGFSGHGFKFASVVGELLADLVIEGHTVPEANLFKMDRLRDLSKVRRLHDFVPQAKL